MPNQPLQGKKEVKAWVLVKKNGAIQNNKKDFPLFVISDKQFNVGAFQLEELIIPCTITYEI